MANITSVSSVSCNRRFDRITVAEKFEKLIIIGVNEGSCSFCIRPVEFRPMPDERVYEFVWGVGVGIEELYVLPRSPVVLSCSTSQVEKVRLGLSILRGMNLSTYLRDVAPFVFRPLVIEHRRRKNVTK